MSNRDAKPLAGFVEARLHEDAARGNHVAQYLVGICLVESGNVDEEGVARKAGEWAAESKATTEGTEEWWPHIRYGSRRNNGQAFEWVRKAAKGGLAEAARLLGAMYLEGRGTAKDGKEAFRWTRTAARAGDLKAQVNLGKFYEGGVGVAVSYERAMKWYRKVAKPEVGKGLYAATLDRIGRSAGKAGGTERKHDPVAQGEALVMQGDLYREGRGVAQDEAKAGRCYRTASELGHRRGQEKWAMCLASGTGVQEDMGQAVHWYGKAARQGSAVAQYRLAIHYGTGMGVQKDHRKAHALLLRSARQGMAAAQRTLGLMYWQGEGVEEDRAEGKKWLQEAVRQGDEEAAEALSKLDGAQKHFEEQLKKHGPVHVTPTGKTPEGKQLYTVAVELGKGSREYREAVRYERGDGVESSQAKAAELHSEAARQGHAEAQFALAWMYEEGRGVKRDDKEAVRWYRAAALQGHVRAMTTLGMRFLTGTGVPKDACEAEHWVQRATKGEEQDSIGAMLARDRLQEVRDARELWRTLAEEAGISEIEYAARQGDARAQCGLALGEGEQDGAGVDEAEAVRLLKLSAGQGFAPGQSALGERLMEGEGVERDEAQGRRLVRAAARQGYPQAMNTLGIWQATGEGMEKDEEEAVRLFHGAAVQNHTGAQVNLGRMHSRGSGTPVDHEEAVQWFRRAASLGEPEGDYELGCAYLQGQGVAASTKRARLHLKRAAGEGHAEAKAALERLDRGTRGTPRGGSGMKRTDAEEAYERGRKLWDEPTEDKDMLEGVGSLALAAEQGHRKARRALHDIAGVPRRPKDDIAETGMVRLRPTGEKVGGRSVYTHADQPPPRRPGKAAKHAHAMAALYLGGMYAAGLGVEKDERYATGCWYEAAKLGHELGLVNYADALEKGTGTERDVESAIIFYHEAAGHGEPTAVGALVDLGVALEGPANPAVRSQVVQKAREGDGDARYVLGMWCLQGAGMPRNPKLAGELLEKGAQTGQRDAQHEVGMRSSKGSEGFELLAAAARQGLERSQVEVGRRLREGRGCQQDTGEAIKWFKKAADCEYAKGLYELGCVYEEGEGLGEDGRDIEKARQLYVKAARQEHEDAKRRLAAIG